MMRLAIAAGLLAAFLGSAAQAEYDAGAYSTCAACHLPDGVGIPGAFPPIRNRVAKIAALDGGREYLIAVVSYGLMGTIQVDGAQYFGVMAGNTGALSADDIAAALNYVVFELNDADTSIEPFSVEEVEKVQARAAAKSPAGGGQMRTDLVDKHGDKWP